MEYSITFKGYRRDCKKQSLPTVSGIYMVYRCVYNIQDDTVSLKDIIYIGQALNLNQRLNNHEKYELFKSKLQAGEELCYAYAFVLENKLDIIENALVYAQEPILNTDLVDHYNHESASFIVEGKCALLKYTHFSIDAE